MQTVISRLAAVVLLLVSFESVAQPVAAFRDGEVLDYGISYKWGLINSEVASAKVVLDQYADGDGRQVFHSVATGSTSGIYDVFFKVREYFETVFTSDSLKPVSFKRDTYEGGYVAKNEYIWRASRDSIDARVFSSGKGERQIVLPGGKDTYDLLSLFYYARTLDFDSMKMNVKYPISFAIDDDVYNLYFIILGREQLTLKGVGTFNTLKFAAKLVAGEVFTGEEEMIIWVTDDRNRVPVYFESPIIVGTAYGKLKSWSGLKYPLTSKVR